MSEIRLSWEDTHRTYHHDRPAPDHYSPGMAAIWNAHGRWHPDCPFCTPERKARLQHDEDDQKQDQQSEDAEGLERDEREDDDERDPRG